MNKSEAITERERLRQRLDAIANDGRPGGAVHRRYLAVTTPIKERIAELDTIIGEVKWFKPRPYTATDRKIAKRFSNFAATPMMW